MMDMCQDIVIVYYGPGRVFHEPEQDFMTHVESIADSVSPLTRSFDCDYLVVTTRANALLLDEATYSWYRSRLRVEPRGALTAQKFVKSILCLLNNGGLKYSRA